jgi:CRISPR/Cas system-associated endoribonuclease Cas2
MMTPAVWLANAPAPPPAEVLAWRDSVFECRLDAEQAGRLSARVATLVDPAEDSVRIYRLCAGCAARVEIQGLGKVIEEDPEILFSELPTKRTPMVFRRRERGAVEVQANLAPGKNHASPESPKWHRSNGGEHK